jgi:hypothetical protein
MCSMCAVVQGSTSTILLDSRNDLLTRFPYGTVDETVINGANLFYPEQFGKLQALLVMKLDPF